VSTPGTGCGGDADSGIHDKKLSRSPGAK
jgi:hypothetical protein